MPGDWEKSVHPDLVDDEPAEQPEAPRSRPPRSRGTDTATSVPPTDQAVGEVTSEAIADSDAAEPSSPEAPATPDWFSQVRDAKDPTEALRSILKNVPYDELEKDDVFSGLVGNVAERRVKALQAKQERDAQEKAKLDAAANNDLYTLGEMTQRELQQQLASQQAAQAAVPFMDGVTLFQQSRDPAVQREVSGKTFGAGKSHAEGVAEYLSSVVDTTVELELKKRESALRKSMMNEINGDEPVPERDSGTPGRVREVTDEQIAAMSLKEYEALFDENGRPKPGVRHRSTRGIPVRQH
jgi:hypothetical protein